MIRLVRVELRKLTTTRSGYGLLATAAAFTILVPPIAPLLALGAALGVLDLFDVVFVLGQVDIVIILDQRRIGDDTFRARPAGFDRHARAFDLAIGQDFDTHAIALLDLVQFATLVVEDVEGRFLAGAQGDEVAATARRFLFQHTQCAEARRRRGADKAGALAMRALARRRFQHAGAQTLAAHFHQAKA